MNKYTIPILFFIVLLATFLRFWNVNQVPVSLYWDEVAIGYNAYAIAETGKDEYGKSFPLLFESYNDYKMPGYIYTAAIGIKFFGLSETTTRLPSVLFGILTVIFTYFLAKQFFLLARQYQDKNEKFLTKNRIQSISLLTAFLLALFPWHLQFSRAAFEANGGLCFVVLGIWLLIKSIQERKFYFLAMLVLAISCYFYRSTLIFVPLLLFAIHLIFLKELLQKNKRIIVAGTILFVVLVAPIYGAVFSPDGATRANEVSVFENLDEEVALHQMWAIQSGNGQLGNIFYNKRIVYGWEILENYFSHFTADFLFLEGDGNGRHGPQNMGLLYLVELPFLLFGLYFIWAYFPRKIKFALYSWLLLAPFPAAISISAPHALRTLHIVPILSLITAIGFFAVIMFCKKAIVRYLVIGVSVLLFLFFVASYLFNYYTTSTFLAAKAWGDGHKQMITAVQRIDDRYEKIIITGHHWQPYTYVLFYEQYDPRLFQESGSSKGFGKYIFGGTSWEKNNSEEWGEKNLKELVQDKKTLVVLSPGEFNKQGGNVKKIDEIRNTNNETIFIIGEL